MSTCPTPLTRTLVGLSIDVPSSVKVGRDDAVECAAVVLASTSEVVSSGGPGRRRTRRCGGITVDGVGTGIGKGTAMVTANYKDRAASLGITVVDAAPAPTPVPARAGPRASARSVARPEREIYGTWRLDVSVSRNTRAADCDMGYPLAYEVEFRQSGLSVTATKLTAAQPGTRPLMLMSVTSQTITGTVSGPTVALSMTFTEDNNITSTGLFTGVLDGRRFRVRSTATSAPAAARPTARRRTTG